MSIFSKIVSGEISAHIVAETADFMAFLDVNPLVMGHVLVIPKKEVDYIFDLDDETLTGLWLFAKRVAKAIDQYTKDVAIRTGVAVVGLDVPHAHIHLVPISNVADMNFAKPKLKLDPKEFESIAEGIRSFLKK